MFQKMLTSALGAGCAAWLLAAVLHFAFVQKYILLGEEYETGAAVHFAGAVPQSRMRTTPTTKAMPRQAMARRTRPVTMNTVMAAGRSRPASRDVWDRGLLRPGLCRLCNDAGRRLRLGPGLWHRDHRARGPVVGHRRVCSLPACPCDGSGTRASGHDGRRSCRAAALVVGNGCGDGDRAGSFGLWPGPCRDRVGCGAAWLPRMSSAHPRSRAFPASPRPRFRPPLPPVSLVWR
jgi:hypothetical protein